MGLLEPAERTRIIKECITPAIDPATNRTRVNWAHLLLATMVDAGYVKRILTTNFDPLIVDALAMTGQPVQTFDLTSSNQYITGVLEPGSVIYLHGQAWGLLLTNTSDETEVVRRHLPVVLQEALADTMLIVVGYSGACDPVFEELSSRVSVFTRRMYWVHYGKGQPEDDVLKMLGEYQREAYLVPGLDADAFMRALVLEGLKVELPPLVRDPLASAHVSLQRIMPFPVRENEPPIDWVEAAKNTVAEAQQYLQKGKEGRPSAEPSGYGSLSIEIAMAGATENLERLNELRPIVTSSGDENLARSLGDAFLSVASALAKRSEWVEAATLLSQIKDMRFTKPEWFHAFQRIVLSDQAKTKEGAEADRLFAQACEKYQRAVEVKPDFLEGLYNWGVALYDQATTKEGAKADRLFVQACEKYQRALEVKPDKHEALYNLACLRACRQTSRDALVIFNSGRNWTRLRNEPRSIRTRTLTRSGRTLVSSHSLSRFRNSTMVSDQKHSPHASFRTK
jgi:tetratricopeptide (TPR) repeat protein